jgi:GNAT superfamily N-acetyltransferase
MQGELYSARHGCQKGNAIMLWDGPDDDIKSLIGWAIMCPVKLRGVAAGTSWTKKRAKFTCMFWVKRQYRRKGYGKMLMDEVIKIDPSPHVFPHDTPSSHMFVDYNVTVTRNDKWWLERAKRFKGTAA